MNDYQEQQLNALLTVKKGLERLPTEKRRELLKSIQPYLQFRETVDAFLHCYFHQVCTKTCYESRTSACCSKDGILTFFADTVIEALCSTTERLNCLESRLREVNRGHRCIYLANDGCLWTVRPVVCAMFLCDKAMDGVFTAFPEAQRRWNTLRRQEKLYKWPDRPVLFDDLEKVFLRLGLRSSLMHLNFSPGLLHIKKKAGY